MSQSQTAGTDVHAVLKDVMGSMQVGAPAALPASPPVTHTAAPHVANVPVQTPFVRTPVPNDDVSPLWLWPIVVVVVLVARVAGRRLRRKTKVDTALRGEDVVQLHPLIATPAAKSADPDAPAGPVQPIEMVRSLLGSAPRTFDRSLKQYLHVDPPAWLKGQKDEMSQSLKEQERLRRDGRITWAVTVQANSLIFRPGPMDHGASVIWSEDSYYENRPVELVKIAQELFQLKGTDQNDPETATFARMLTNERIRAMRLKVPKRFTEGRAVFHSSLMLTRKHLPQGHLARNIMPVWVDPNPTGLILLIPAAYWPASLMHWWQTPDPQQQEQPSEKNNGPIS